LRYIERKAMYYSRVTGYPLDDYLDHGSHLMANALACYDPATGHSLLAAYVVHGEAQYPPSP
jgi:hypothetical protein